jgi:membrane associated rhomboid family serine protease
MFIPTKFGDNLLNCNSCRAILAHPKTVLLVAEQLDVSKSTQEICGLKFKETHCPNCFQKMKTRDHIFQIQDLFCANCQISFIRYSSLRVLKNQINLNTRTDYLPLDGFRWSYIPNRYRYKDHKENEPFYMNGLMVDDNPLVNPPFATIVFVLISTAVFILTLYNPTALSWFFQSKDFFDQNPLIWFKQSILSTFAHGSVAHLLGNMLFLWIVGDNIEDLWGRWRFTIFFIISAIISDIVSMIFSSNPYIPSIGASGAIFSLIGAYLVLYPNVNIRLHAFSMRYGGYSSNVPVWVVFGIWFGTIQAIGVSTNIPGIGWEAHIGGFLFGISVGGYYRLYKK